MRVSANPAKERIEQVGRQAILQSIGRCKGDSQVRLVQYE